MTDKKTLNLKYFNLKCAMNTSSKYIKSNPKEIISDLDKACRLSEKLQPNKLLQIFKE